MKEVSEILAEAARAVERLEKTLFEDRATGRATWESQTALLLKQAARIKELEAAQGNAPMPAEHLEKLIRRHELEQVQKQRDEAQTKLAHVAEAAERAYDLCRRLFAGDFDDEAAAQTEILVALREASTAGSAERSLLAEQRKRVQGLKEGLQLAENYRRDAAATVARQALRLKELEALRLKELEAVAARPLCHYNGRTCEVHPWESGARCEVGKLAAAYVDLKENIIPRLEKELEEAKRQRDAARVSSDAFNVAAEKMRDERDDARERFGQCQNCNTNRGKDGLCFTVCRPCWDGTNKLLGRETARCYLHVGGRQCGLHYDCALTGMATSMSIQSGWMRHVPLKTVLVCGYCGATSADAKPGDECKVCKAGHTK